MGEIVLPYHVQQDGSRRFETANSQYLGTTAFSPEISNGITINCWFRLKAVSQWHGLVTVSRSASANDYRALQINTSNKVFYKAVAAAGDVSTTADAAVLDRWSMATALETGPSNRGCYLDASSFDAATDTQNIDDSNNQLVIGCLGRNTYVRYADADIAEVAIWDIPLSTSELAYLFNNRNPRPAYAVRPESLVYYDPLGTGGRQLPPGVNVPHYPLTNNNGVTYSTGPPRERTLVGTHKTCWSYPSGAPPAPNIAGSATAVADTVGNLTITHPVAGDTTAVAETLGALTISHVVAGDTTAVAETVGDLTITHPVAGDTTAVAETLGSLAVSSPGGIAGQASAVADTLGGLTIIAPIIPLTGTSTAVADTIGDLTLAPPQAIAGSSTAVGATNGNLAINVPGGVTGRTSGVVDTAGELAITHVVAGTCTAVSDTVGSLSLTGPGAVSGSSTAVADTAGTLTVTAPELISGSSTAVADTLGSLTITHVIAGSATAVCDTLGFIPVGTFTPVPCRICTPADSNPTCVVPDSNPTCKSTEC